MSITSKQIDEATKCARAEATHLQSCLNSLAQDKEKPRRMSLGLCRVCFYLKRTLSGQMFCDYTCAHCKGLFTHPNTSIPKLCSGCSAELTCCCRCLASLTSPFL